MIIMKFTQIRFVWHKQESEEAANRVQLLMCVLRFPEVEFTMSPLLNSFLFVVHRRLRMSS